jgi:hypothetical protein
LLKTNIIELALKYLQYDNLEVKFKALGIIRLLVRNCTEQTGLQLLFEDSALATIESLAFNPHEHPGIAGESSRLACYLPLAAKSEKNLLKFCARNMIPVISLQLKCSHFIMVNEALLAINVMITINYR